MEWKRLFAARLLAEAKLETDLAINEYLEFLERSQGKQNDRIICEAIKEKCFNEINKEFALLLLLSSLKDSDKNIRFREDIADISQKSYFQEPTVIEVFFDVIQE
ncbi:MAG: hypothetical protein HC890_11105 [Chloroflexaceae bacterium]|nr:hypothetical protein [Chloroflexaceae bacterium]